MLRTGIETIICLSPNFLYVYVYVYVLILVLVGLVLCCETRSCYARRHNDLEKHSDFSSTVYSFSILCLEHHYCGDQQWRLLT